MSGFPYQGGAFGEFAFGDLDNNITMVIDTAAAITAAGQSVLAAIGLAIDIAGTVSISGQTVLATLGMAITTSAMVTASGQEINLRPRFVTGPLFIRKLASGRAAVLWKGRST